MCGLKFNEYYQIFYGLNLLQTNFKQQLYELKKNQVYVELFLSSVSNFKF